MISLEPGSTLTEKPPFLKRAADLIRELYRNERAMWKAHYKRYFTIAARALGLGFVIGFVFFLIHPEQEKRALAYLMKALKDIPLGAAPLDLALTLFYHNVRASALAVAAGIIPFACLPALDPLANGAALGLLASVSKHQGLNVPLLFLRSVAPHGIIELPAVLYATSAGIYLSVSFAKRVLAKLRKKKDDTAMTPSASPGGPDSDSFLESYPEKSGPDTEGAGGNVVRSFMIVVLPLLLVAAFIEAFITPLLR
jgi:stage II sporulation protein M